MREEVCRILIVEDNLADVRLIQESLRMRGIRHEIEHHETAQAGICAVKRYGLAHVLLPQIILLDYNLPAGDARDVLCAANDNPALANIPKAVITCSIAPKDREQALECGADAFIFKPADLDSFLTEVGDSIERLLN